MRDVVLLCEGKHGQIDQSVLNSLVNNGHGVSAKIKTVGGSSSLGSAKEFLEHEATRGPSASSVVQSVIFTIQDRDFRPLAKAESTWADASCRQLIWRRHEIENYLLEPAVVHTWFESLRQKPPPNTAVDRLPATLAEVETLISNLARGSIEHHVGNVVFAEIQQSNWIYTDTLQLALPKRSGAVVLNPNRFPAPSRTDWLNALNLECKRVQHNRHKTGRVPCWTANRIRQRYDSLLAELNLPGYFAARTYLLDFEGKGLLWGLSNRLLHLARHSISIEDLVSELIKVLLTAYTNFKPYQPDEFEDLASRMKQASR